MKRKIGCLAVVLAVFWGSNLARADSEFYVIAAGPTAVGTKITSVPYEIKNSGFYYLTGNLNYSGSGNAITVTANDVTLDLMGFSLTGTGAAETAGIYSNGRSNVEIRNGTVRNFDAGVVGNNPINGNGNKHRVINVRATNNGGAGIYLAGKNHLIKNCSSSDNGAGLAIFGSGLITDSVANNNVTGISMTGPGSVLGNTACNNTGINFSLGNLVATSILVDRNSAFGLNTNYSNNANPSTGVLITGNNSGTP